MKKYKCKICGKKIHYCTWHYGNKRCGSCAQKGKNNAAFKYNISKKKLYNLYWKKKLSIMQIAKKINCCYLTIYNKMKTYNIKRRTLSEAGKGIKRPELSGLFGKNDIIKHHIYGKKYKKIWKLSRANHTKLHHNAYFYILKKYGRKGIDDYIKWFKKELKLYNGKYQEK